MLEGEKYNRGTANKCRTLAQRSLARWWLAPWRARRTCVGSRHGSSGAATRTAAGKQRGVRAVRHEEPRLPYMAQLQPRADKLVLLLLLMMLF